MRFSIVSLYPVLDKNGLLHIGGHPVIKSRLPHQVENAMIIPGNQHIMIAMLIVRHFHETVKHQGRYLTEDAVPVFTG